MSSWRLSHHDINKFRWALILWVVALLSLLLEADGFQAHTLQHGRPRLLPHSFLSAQPSSITSQAVTSESESGDQQEYGIYVHIPYCRRRCRYCNFAIVPIGSRVNTETQTIMSSGDTTILNDNEKKADTATQGFLDMDESYRASLLEEIEWIRRTRTNGSSGMEEANLQTPFQLKSIYFGGGTPSLAPLETVQAILDALLKPPPNSSNNNPLFELKSTAEVSIEMDPGTFSLDKLQALKVMGFNRISLGVQSFDDTILESIGRVHRRKDVEEAIAMIETVFGGDENGINYSIDLISGLPGLSLALWAETLAIATAIDPPPSHISLYDLQIEQGTVFSQWYNKGNDDDNDDGSVHTSQRTRSSSPISLPTSRSNLPSEEDCAFMYKYAAGYLRAKGFEHYEVSSYAYVGNQNDSVINHQRPRRSRPGGRSNRSQHNQIYWELDGQWFALGLGATSFVHDKLIARPRTLDDYQKWVETHTKETADDESFLMDPQEYLTDVIMKRLRTSDGLDLNWIESKYGKDCVDSVTRGAALGLELGLMTLNDEEDHHNMGRYLRLVDPDGFLYSNNLISSIFVELGE